MDSESLITLAAVHGIDLLAAARVATKPSKGNTVTKRKNGVTSTILVEPKANAARGKATRTSIKPQWTFAEVGIAAAGVPPICMMCALYVYAGSDADYWKLRNTLVERARIMQKERVWPIEVADYHFIKRPYIEHLAKLVLDEARSPHFFKLAPELYAAYMGVSVATWEKQLQSRYFELKAVWEDWVTETVRRVQHKLSQRE